jgi:hypothetical protein
MNRPYKEDAPCLACIHGDDYLKSFQEEISNEKKHRQDVPAYVPDWQVKEAVQVGLSSDIAPIANLMVKLALFELSR